MLIATRHGYEFHLPDSGGKAGRGKNATSTIQVRRGNQIVKQFRFPMDDAAKRSEVIDRAKSFVDDLAGWPASE